MEEPTPSVFAQVREVFRNHVADDADFATPDTHFRDDSPYTDDIDHVVFWMDIEAHFGLRIPDEIMDEMSTIGDVVRFIEQGTPQGAQHIIVDLDWVWIISLGLFTGGVIGFAIGRTV